MAKTIRNDIVKETDVAGVYEDFTEPDDTTVVVLDPVQLKSLEFIAKHWETLFDYNKKPKKGIRNREIRKSVEINVETKNVEEVAPNIEKEDHEQRSR